MVTEIRPNEGQEITIGHRLIGLFELVPKIHGSEVDLELVGLTLGPRVGRSKRLGLDRTTIDEDQLETLLSLHEGIPRPAKAGFALWRRRRRTEGKGGDTIHPATCTGLEQFQRRRGWVH
jgi:hypothetical protein